MMGMIYAAVYFIVAMQYLLCAHCVSGHQDSPLTPQITNGA